jgi:hypothetical protein
MRLSDKLQFHSFSINLGIIMPQKIGHFALAMLPALIIAFAFCISATAFDSSEHAVAPKPSVARKLVFQQGVDGYQGTVDTEIWALAPSTILESNGNASSDANNDGGESQVLIRFDDIIGSASRAIPKGSRIRSAKLFVSAFDQGSTVNLHRMYIPFSKSATWNSLVDGVSADGLEASRHKDSFTFGKIAANSSTVVFDVTDTVQYWASGRPNHGWVFLNTGGNGWDFYTSEFDDIKQRPRLEVEFSEPTSQWAVTSKQ